MKLFALESLKGTNGYEVLYNLLNKLMSRDDYVTVWEEIEHALAAAKEASYFKDRGLIIELEETLGQKDQKKPDFRVRINGKQLHVEIKTSSMFPGERVFLDKVLSVFDEELNELNVPYRFLLLLRYDEQEITKKIPILIAELKELATKLSKVRRKDMRPAHPLLNTEAVLLLIRAPSPRNIEQLLKRYIDLIDYINLEMLSERLKTERRYLLAIDANIPNEEGDIFAAVEDKAMLIGRLSVEKEKERIGRILRDALKKALMGDRYIVTIYSREVILKNMEPSIIQDIFSKDKFNEISGLVIDLEVAGTPSDKSIHKRMYFENRNAMVKLDPEIVAVIKSML